MMIAPLAEHASMNAPLRLSQKAINTKSIPKFAPNVAHAQMYARWKQSILSNRD